MGFLMLSSMMITMWFHVKHRPACVIGSYHLLPAVIFSQGSDLLGLRTETIPHPEKALFHVEHF